MMSVVAYPNLSKKYEKYGKSNLDPKLYIPSTLNNSNRAYTFICLGIAGRFGSAKTALEFKYEI